MTILFPNIDPYLMHLTCTSQILLDTISLIISYIFKTSKKLSTFQECIEAQITNIL